MKKCARCGETKALEDFHRDRGRPDGRFSYCKICNCARIQAHKETKAGAIASMKYRTSKAGRAGYRRRSKSYANKIKAMRATPEGKARRKAEGVKYRTKNKAKRSAHGAVSSAIRSGKITAPDNCSRCGSADSIQAHHTSYSVEDWLNVEWLCGACHGAEHEAENNIKRLAILDEMEKERT